MKNMSKYPGMLLNKGVATEVLPNRHAMNTLTGGDPLQRTMNNYAKASPVDLTGVGEAARKESYPLNLESKIT